MQHLIILIEHCSLSEYLTSNQVYSLCRISVLHSVIHGTEKLKVYHADNESPEGGKEHYDQQIVMLLLYCCAEVVYRLFHVLRLESKGLSDTRQKCQFVVVA